MNLVWVASKERVAVQNMAIDRGLLDFVGLGKNVCFRPYGWSEPSFTFGYTQRLREVQNTVSEGVSSLCRRPTGGGVVDHRNDWTYALAISINFEVSSFRPETFYRWLHSLIAEEVETQGIGTHLCEEDVKVAEGADVCFRDPSPGDVICSSTEKKIAGAALKRTKLGILVQGSILRETVPSLDFNTFESGFVSRILHSISDLEKIEKLEAVKESFWRAYEKQYADLSWNRRR
ncbi:MAG: hypothetical protein MI748_13280 [Opitutales bacterium]|nr:hypothetical protein [Opitutales bacterium]